MNTIVLSRLSRLLHHIEVRPDELTESVYEKIQAMLIQSAQLDPAYQALNAINMALCHLQVQSREVSGLTAIPVYANGIGPEKVGQRVEAALSGGFTIVKIKVGFNRDIVHKNFVMAQKIAGRGKGTLVSS